MRIHAKVYKLGKRTPVLKFSDLIINFHYFSKKYKTLSDSRN